jgi:chromatin remodeling complex protein RSC6
MTLQKKTLDETFKDLKVFEKTLTKMIKKHTKNVMKVKKPRKLSGFALPMRVSDCLCEFMKVEKGTKIARTDVTKYLMNYIEKHNLKKPDEKQIIVPNEELWKIVGDEAKNAKITHFTIQKYINKHFIK